MYDIQISPLAKEDLLKIRSYLIREFGGKIAEQKVRIVIESIRKFQEFPLMGRPLSNIIDIPTDYMYFVTEKNYIFYRLEKHTVKIIRIIDTRQEYIGILFGNG